MTREQRILFELSDLRRVRLVCRRCDGEISYPVHSERGPVYPPDYCTHCNAPLGTVRGENSLVGKFLFAMQQVMANDETLKVGLKFEMEDEGGEKEEAPKKGQ